MDGVRRKDAAAAHDLVEHLYPLVIRIVRSHLPRRCGEEDLAQEVFLKLFSRLEGYRERPGIPFEHWVSRLAVRTCLDSLRAERRRPELRWGDLAEETVAWLRYMVSAADVTPHTSAAAARESLEVLLRQLLPADRLVITLLDLEEAHARAAAEDPEPLGCGGRGTEERAHRNHPPQRRNRYAARRRGRERTDFRAACRVRAVEAEAKRTVGSGPPQRRDAEEMTLSSSGTTIARWSTR